MRIVAGSHRGPRLKSPVGGALRPTRDRIREALARKSSDPTQVMNGFAAADFSGKLNAFDEFQVRNRAYKQVNGVALEHEIEIEVLERGESGHMGMAFHPDLPAEPWLYLVHSSGRTTTSATS